MEHYTLSTYHAGTTKVLVVEDDQSNRIELWPAKKPEKMGGGDTMVAHIYQHDIWPYRANEAVSARATAFVEKTRARLEREYMQETPDSTWLPTAINNWLEKRDFTHQLENGRTFNFDADAGLIGRLVPPTQPRAEGFDPGSIRKPNY